MNKSTNLFSQSNNIADITTYQSGVIQSTANRALKKQTDSYLAEYDLTSMQWFIVGTIYDAGDNGVSITDLAKMVDTTVPFVTTTIQLLEARGIAEKSGHLSDRRGKQVRIHPDYRSTVEDIEIALREKMRRSIYALITREELTTYIRVLARFSELK